MRCFHGRTTWSVDGGYLEGGWDENWGQSRYLHLQRRGYLEPAAVKGNRQRLIAFRIASKFSPRKIHCTHKVCVLIYTSASWVHEHHCSNSMLCVKVASLNILNKVIVSISEIRGETARKSAPDTRKRPHLFDRNYLL